MAKSLYFYDEGDGKNKRLLGGKGAGLCTMTQLGLPVPPGFVITTEVCKKYSELGGRLPDGLMDEVRQAVHKLEERTGKRFGDSSNPLLVSIRSGAMLSMPGMMDTILNLGLNDESVKGLAALTKNERFANDAYRRFIQMFGKIVLEVPGEKFDEIFENWKRKVGAKKDTELTAEHLGKIVEDFKGLLKKVGKEFPSDPWKQLELAIAAVFRSWNNKRAIEYRNFYKIPHDLGTAVNVVTMVFGNMGEDSGTGVAFTRNPATGEKGLYGEFLFNAQGEDVVAGIRTPLKISELKQRWPEIYNQLLDIAGKLERYYRDMQDMEFTVERGKLYMLQTRTGKRTAQAAVKIAVDMADEGLIKREEAILRIEPAQLEQLLHKHVDPKAKVKVIAKGLNASPGAAVGKVVFDSERAKELGEKGEKVILVRPETNPDDVGGIIAAQGVLTSRGGMTCVGGKSIILTDEGFMTAEAAFRKLERGAKFRILSYDTKHNTACWRRVIAAGRRISPAVRIEVSQTGRADGNTLEITPDHKFLVFSGRRLVKKPILEVVKHSGFILAVDKIPHACDVFEAGDLAYLCGALSSDGYIRVDRRHGQVVFTQKDTLEKRPFINAVQRAYAEIFEKTFTGRAKYSKSYLRGREVEGEAVDFVSYRKLPALVLSDLQRSEEWLLEAGEGTLWKFLAGVVDGDGSFAKSSKRINIYVGKPRLLRQIVLACLRLGILPQVSKNRNIYNVQIVERVNELLSYCYRLKGKVWRKRYRSSKYFPAREILADCVDEVNHEGKIRFYVEGNRLISDEVLRRRVLPLASPPLRSELERVLNSSVRTMRLHVKEDIGEIPVYNFEVEASNELDKNFVVFTKRFTPVLISNSHAAVVTRGLGKPAVVGCESIEMNEEKHEFRAEDVVVKEGDVITLNGTTGEVILGEAPLVEPKMSKELLNLLSWCDEIKRLENWANADYPRDAKRARELGAQGIGLCRTEHMFFESERLPIFREVILEEDPKRRKDLLERLKNFQKSDFKEILREMDGLPVVIRLLDPPLHEFLPRPEQLLEEVIMRRMGGKQEELRGAEQMLRRVEELREVNPMMGLRGCRLGLTHPDINEMQVRAIFEAACELKREGLNPRPEVMIPLVSHVNELKAVREQLERVAKEVMKQIGIEVPYKFGTMIEVPRAALTADEIAEYAEFFSFGTNDLTQMTFAFSRDDAERKFLFQYLEKKILPNDPFQTLDRSGVGKLMQMGVELGRKRRPNLEIGICGEHGGDPESIEFCHEIGLNYVSCSPFRIPVARLAAAQAALRAKPDRESYL